MNLAAIIADKIQREGPISVADYMNLCLAHPDYGYYITRNPLGAAGDFTTAPEISQIFGELLGLWLAESWRQAGGPEACLIELGPGRGTLMRDALRATCRIPDFHARIDVHLVETSPALTAIQQQTLTHAHPRLHWHQTPDSLPASIPWLILANEFFDALPVRQFVHGPSGVTERRIALDEQNPGGFRFEPAPSAPQMIEERSEASEHIMRALARHIATRGGAMLMADYGELQGSGDTLQAVRNHAYANPLSTPGECDLTTQVRFQPLIDAAHAEGCRTLGPVPQGDFLRRLGAELRAAQLCARADETQRQHMLSGLMRLMAPDQMGRLFKLLAVTDSASRMSEGFA